MHIAHCTARYGVRHFCHCTHSTHPYTCAQTDKFEWTACDVFTHPVNGYIFVLFRYAECTKDGRMELIPWQMITLRHRLRPSQAVSIKLQFQLNRINRKSHCSSDSIVQLNFAFSSCSDDKFYYAHVLVHRIRSHRSISLLILIEFFNMFAHIFTHYCFANKIKCLAQTASQNCNPIYRVSMELNKPINPKIIQTICN